MCRRRCRRPARLLALDRARSRTRRRSARTGSCTSLKPDRARGGLQRGLRRGVALGVVVDEEHRPAEHGAVDRRAGARLGQRLQVPQVAGDHVEVAHRAAAADVGVLLDQRRAEHALHRAHQPAVDAVDVGRTAARPKSAFGGLVRGRPSTSRTPPSACVRWPVLQRDQCHAGPARAGDATAELRCRSRSRSKGGSSWLDVQATGGPRRARLCLCAATSAGPRRPTRGGWLRRVPANACAGPPAPS